MVSTSCLANCFSSGVKDFFIHLREPSVLRWITQQKDFRIIHLVRANIVQRALSRLRLQRTGEVLQRSVVGNPEPLYFEPKDVLYQLLLVTEEAEEEARLMEQMDHLPILSVSFEEYLQEPGGTDLTHQRVFEFLGVPPLHVTTGHRRIRSPRLEDSIANLSEIQQALCFTPWEGMLD